MKEAKGHILYGMVVGTPEDLQALQPRMVAEGRASSELGSWATLVGVGVPFVNQASCSLCFPLLLRAPAFPAPHPHPLGKLYTHPFTRRCWELKVLLLPGSFAFKQWLSGESGLSKVQF